MKVQVVVAWAVSELASHYPKSEDLSLRTINATSTHAVVLASNKPANENLNLKVLEDDEMKKITNPLGNGNKKASNFQNVIETTMAVRTQTKNPTNGVNGVVYWLVKRGGIVSFNLTKDKSELLDTVDPKRANCVLSDIIRDKAL
nr:putative armadillo-type fold protein [Ipomoea batatas]